MDTDYKMRQKFLKKSKIKKKFLCGVFLICSEKFRIFLTIVKNVNNFHYIAPDKLEANRTNFTVELFNWTVDLAVLVNSNMLITNIISKSAKQISISSTSASKFEFLKLPYARVVNNSNLNSYVTQIYSTALTFLVDAHSNLYNPRI